MSQIVNLLKKLLSWRSVLWLLPLILIGWIVVQNYVPRGVLEVRYTAQNGSKAITDFASKEPVQYFSSSTKAGNQKMTQLISTSPLYFTLNVPRPFPKATISMTYQNPEAQPLFKLGVLQANDQYSFEVMAHYSPLLEELLNIGDTDGWQSITEGNKLLLQRGDKKYSTIDEFNNDRPADDVMLQYNYPVLKSEALPGYRAQDTVMAITKSLRGSHEIYAYTGIDEQIDITFTFQDINRHVGEDTVKVTVYNFRGDEVANYLVNDDGETFASGRVHDEQILRVAPKTNTHGTYRILIETNDDVFIKRIESYQHLLMFNKAIYLTDNEEYKDILGNKIVSPTTLYTNATALSASTAHDDGFQTLTVGSEEFDIAESHIEYDILDLTGATKIISPANDIYIEGAGKFAFSQEQLFDPTFGLIPSINDVDSLDGFEYIIAEYKKPDIKGAWHTATATVEVPELYYSNNMVHFIITLPGLPENGRLLHVQEVSVVLEKEPITLSNFFTKIKNKLSK